MADPPSEAVRGSGGRVQGVLTMLAISVGAAVGAAVLILVSRPEVAAALVAVAAAALVVGGTWADDARASRLPFAVHVAELAVDAAILGALAWASLPADGATATAALTALIASYLSSYLRAKATGLGFPLDEAPFVRPLRLGLVTVAVFAGDGLALWFAAAISTQSLVRGAVSVARREEPR